VEDGAVKMAALTDDTASRSTNHSKVHHLEWRFRAEAAVWSESGVPLRPNFYRFASELRKWMLREESLLPILLPDNNALTNPYSMAASGLIAAFRQVSNDSALSVPATSNIVRAEVHRVRLYSEFVLYLTRIGETLIKQLLYCTGFSEKLYRRASSNQLLAQSCIPCRKEAGRRHRVSMLGSMAHQYDMCSAFDYCLDSHLKTLAQLRNKTAAHSATPAFLNYTVPGSTQMLHDDIISAGNEYVHILQHIADIENQMWRSTDELILNYSRDSAINSLTGSPEQSE
jgi:hypothetical protein